jgi:hypothetical protein
VNDATILIRDIAGDAASKAADKVNPSEEKLKQIDQPADDDTWHDVPDMSAGNIKSQVKATYNKNAPSDGVRGNLKEAVGDASEQASGSRDPQEAAEQARQDQQEGTNHGVDGVAGLKAGASTLKQKADENTSEETKDLARARKEQTRNYLSKKMPEERREQTIWRLKKMVVEIQGHPDCTSLFRELLMLANIYRCPSNQHLSQLG